MSKTSIFEKPTNGSKDQVAFAVKIDRSEAMKGRLRTRSLDTDEDIVIDLPRGQVVSNGSVFGPSEGGHYYKIEIAPERVVRVSIERNKEDLSNWIKLGYHIGNHHLEAMIEGDSAYIPATIGEDKIKDILRKSYLSLSIEPEERILGYESGSYFAGEESN